MAWFKGDDNLPFNPKILAAESAEDCWFYVCCLAHSAKSLTDGFIAESAVPILGPHFEAPRQNVERLVDLKLLERVAGGYSIPDYLAYNPSREQVVARREADRERQERHRLSRRDTDETSAVSPRVPSSSRPVPVTTSPSSSTTEPASEPEDEQLIEQVLEAIASHKLGLQRDITNPQRWKAKVKANDRTELGSAIARLVGEFPTAPVSMLAAAALGESTPHLAGYRRVDPSAA